MDPGRVDCWPLVISRHWPQHLAYNNLIKVYIQLSKTVLITIFGSFVFLIFLNSYVSVLYLFSLTHRNGLMAFLTKRFAF